MDYQVSKFQIDDMVEYMICQKKILRPSTFRKVLEFKLNARSKGCWGGIKNKIPLVNIGVKNNGRYSDRDQWLAHIKATLWGTRQKVWKEALEHANEGRWMFVEYSHIHAMPHIGGFISSDPAAHATAILAHELSHAIDHWNRRCGNGVKDTAHGSEWRHLYRHLRMQFVNHLI